MQNMFDFVWFPFLGNELGKPFQIIIIIIIIFFYLFIFFFLNTFVHSIYIYVPETNPVSTVCSVAAVVYLQFVLHVMLFRLWNMFVLWH